jgi:hypothetical protein
MKDGQGSGVANPALTPGWRKGKTAEERSRSGVGSHDFRLRKEGGESDATRETAPSVLSAWVRKRLKGLPNRATVVAG